MNYMKLSNTSMFEEDHFSKNAQGTAMIMNEVLFSMKILQTKPQIENMNKTICDLHHTIILISSNEGREN